MEISRLYYLIELANTNSFSETAANLHTTQGNVSKQIAALEKELGVSLVARNKRSVALTPAGELALAHAKRLTFAFHAMKYDLHLSVSGKGQPL